MNIPTPLIINPENRPAMSRSEQGKIAREIKLKLDEIALKKELAEIERLAREVG